MPIDTVDHANEQIRTRIGHVAQMVFRGRNEFADLVDIAGEPRRICSFDIALLSTLVREAVVPDVVRLLFAVERQAVLAARRKPAPDEERED